MHDDSSNVISTPGNITNFPTPKFEIPKIIENEQMGDVLGKVSKDVSGKQVSIFWKDF